ncbi:hypothetical protein NONO_c08580 [Nocardia nova SH22a]|uniref:DUF2637 domain-containing protein n=1 Tax=Nocardia nova SH22a TaxID=1415166 RepID=W5T8K8_9NOCA|nr:hypothetical protein [Nocardia nova]AHH15665.1 hypothetical protein NONO_c08580 [Nocardia nova SH22a]
MLDEQSTGTSAEQSADSAHRSRRGADARTSVSPGGPALPAELSALAQRVATARGKLPLQADPALFAELSDREITAERELAEWIRTQRRQQRKRAVSAELTAEKRDRRVALALRRADESDARWHRRARAARMRVSNSDARLAQLFRRAEWSSRALIGVVILGMVWAGVNVQHNLVPSGDMSDPLYWLSYGFEAMISIPIITIMVVATTAARWGREIDRGKVVFLETALLGVTIALNAGPHLVGGEPARAAEAAVAPVMVGVVIWLHSWVSARYAQLIDDIPVEEIDSDDPRPSGYRPSYRPDDLDAWTDALPDPDVHNYPQLTPLLPAREFPQDAAFDMSGWNTSVPQGDPVPCSPSGGRGKQQHLNSRGVEENYEFRTSPAEFTNSAASNSHASSKLSANRDNSPAPTSPISTTISADAAPFTESARHEPISELLNPGHSDQQQQNSQRTSTANDPGGRRAEATPPAHTQTPTEFSSTPAQVNSSPAEVTAAARHSSPTPSPADHAQSAETAPTPPTNTSPAAAAPPTAMPTRDTQSTPAADASARSITPPVAHTIDASAASTTSRSTPPTADTSAPLTANRSATPTAPSETPASDAPPTPTDNLSTARTTSAPAATTPPLTAHTTDVSTAHTTDVSTAHTTDSSAAPAANAQSMPTADTSTAPAPNTSTTHTTDPLETPTADAFPTQSDNSPPARITRTSAATTTAVPSRAHTTDSSTARAANTQSTPTTDTSAAAAPDDSSAPDTAERSGTTDLRSDAASDGARPSVPDTAEPSSAASVPEATQPRRSTRRAEQRHAQSAALHIVSDEPHKIRTRRAVDDAVQLVLGEPAESPARPAASPARPAASPARPAAKSVPADAKPDRSAPTRRAARNLDALADDSPNPEPESDAPELDDEFDSADIEAREALADDHAGTEGGDVAIWSVAREIRKRGLSKLPVEQLAEILTLTDESWTPAAIGAEVGLPGSRILGILETARRISMPLAVGG